MNEIDEFFDSVCGTNPLEATGFMYALHRKISPENLDGYHYKPRYDHYEEGDALFKARIKSQLKQG